jgi:surface protein
MSALLMPGAAQQVVAASGIFKTTWLTTSPSESITIPLIYDTQAVDIGIDWGDGSTDVITAWNQAELTHSYASAGTHTVQMRGRVHGWRFANSGSKSKIKTIEAWGGFDFSVTYGFHGCNNLNVTATDVPVITHASGLLWAFRACSALVTLPSSSLWDTSVVTSLALTFRDCPLFNADLTGWDTSLVTDLGSTFQSCTAFTGTGLGGWSVGNVTAFGLMFLGCTNFNVDLSSWDVSKSVSFSSMFQSCSNFNNGGQPLSWTMPSAQDFHAGVMFRNCPVFTGSGLSSWNMSRCYYVTDMFRDCVLLNFDASGWGMSNKVTSYSSMFFNCPLFDSDLDGWDFSAAISIGSMFSACKLFNNGGSAGIDNWDVANVVSLQSTFSGCTIFNQPLNNWNTVKVTDMSYMFRFCSAFNQDISNFDTHLVTTFAETFRGCTAFAQNLGGWDVSALTTAGNMFLGSGLPTANYNNLLIGWAAQTVNTGVSVNFGSSKYSGGAATTARATLVATPWTITDGGAVVLIGFITTWTTTASLQTITLPLISTGTYDFHVDWGDGSGDDITAYNQAEIAHEYATADTYTMTITGTITGWKFNNGGDKTKIASVENWGPLVINSPSAFYGCSNLTVSATDIFDVSGTDLAFTFSYCTSLVSVYGLHNLDVSGVLSLTSFHKGCTNLQSVNASGWDVSSVTSFYGFVQDCNKVTALDITGWDTAAGTTFSAFFIGCLVLPNSVINTAVAVINVSTAATNISSCFKNCRLVTSLDLSGWVVTNVTDFSSLFTGCHLLTDVDVSTWNTAKVTAFASCFSNCYAIDNLDLSSWDISKGVSFASAFASMRALVTFTPPGVGTGTAAVSFHQLFSGSYSIVTLDLSGWVTTNVTSFNGVFQNCQALTTLDVSTWNTAKVTTFASCFLNCYVLNNLDLSSWNLAIATAINSLFAECRLLSVLTLPGTGTSTTLVTASNIFSNCYALPSLDLSGWVVTNVTSLSTTFRGCSVLTSLNVSGWNTAKVTIMSNTFYGCSLLTTVEVDTWSILALTAANTMFTGVTLSTAKYDQILVAWDGQTHNNSVAAGFGSSTYTTGGAAETARTALVGDSWTITDGGAA